MTDFRNAPDWHVLVLHDGQEKDILGIWGPYTSDVDARTALQELQNWPIDGTWSIFACKHFTPPTSTPAPTQYWLSPHNSPDVYRTTTTAGGER